MKQLYSYMLGIVCCLCASQAFGQQLPVMNHYIYNPYLYNPARTGQDDMGTISTHFRKQWTSLPYSPLTAALTVDAPIKNTVISGKAQKNKVGIGGMLYTDQMHLLNKVGGMASYAYGIYLGKGTIVNHHLSLGLSVGVVNQRLDFAAATIANETDLQLLAEASTGTAMDFSLGLNYNINELNVGFSMLQGLNNTLKYIGFNSNINSGFVQSRHFVMSASYRFLLGPEDKKHRFFVKPIFLGRVVKALPFQAEANVVFGVDGIAWLGLGYRSSNNETSTSAIDITVGTEIKRRIKLAYTFELSADGGLNASLGPQHEFMLAYRFGKNAEQESKMKELERKVELLENKNVTIEERINEYEKNTETLVTRIDSIKQETASSEEQQKKMEEQIAAYQDELDKQNETILSNKKEIEELKRMLDNQPLKYKKLGQVFFDKGSADMSREIKANLDAVKDVLKDKKEPVTVYLYGSASTDGDAKKNMELSIRRASIVRKYLINTGANVKEVKIIPMGEENPASGSDSKVESQDRRVDIIVAE